MSFNDSILSGHEIIVSQMAEERPHMSEIWKDIFPQLDQPHNGQVIGIVGKMGSGKTMLIQQLLARTLAPTTWGGRQAYALSMDLRHTNGWKLVHRILKSFIENINVVQQEIEDFGEDENDRKLSNQLKMKLQLDEILKSLIMLDCYSDEQLGMALKDMDTVLWSNGAIAVVAIDSLDQFYWDKDSRRCRETKRHVTYCQELLDRIRQLAIEHKVCFVYSLDMATAATSELMKTVNDFNIVLDVDENTGLRTINQRPITINERGIQLIRATK